MPRPPKKPHTAALGRMLRHTGLDNVPEEAPLVALLRTLAAELDAGGGSRPRIEYRAALKDARMVLNATVRGKPKSDPAAVSVPEPPEPPEPDGDGEDDEIAEPTSLAKFKEDRGIG